MDPWEPIRKAASDKRSGSVEIALRAAQGVGALTSRRDVMRAARALLRAHPVMAPLWRLLAAAVEDPGGPAVGRYTDLLDEGSRSGADAIRWVVGKRATVVLTHSASGSVAEALGRVRAKVARVICTASLPGGEGRAFAKRLERDGFSAEVIPDASMGTACGRADLVLVGADAVTDEVVVNKTGTLPLALCAREAGIPCYAVAATAKLIPHHVVDRDAPLYDATPLDLFDAVLTERGAQRPAAIRRAARRISIPQALEAIKT